MLSKHDAPPTRPPDLVVFLTDQERAPPPYESPDLTRWRRDALVAHRWFAEHGVSFERHYTGATACVPSRPTLLTGQYPDLHGVTQTDGLGKVATDRRMRWLRVGEVPTVGHYLRLLGYDTHYVGKWHVSHADLHGPDGQVVRTNTKDGAVLPEGVRAYREARALEPYGFSGWIGPEPHGARASNSGLVRDPLYADQAIAFIDERDEARQRGDAKALRPFLLLVSFVNPHDIVLWPRWASKSPLEPDPRQPPPVPEAPTQYEDLRTKPAAQVAYRDAYYETYGPGPLIRRAYRGKAAEYRRTYMRLHLEVDRQIERVLASLLASSHADEAVMVLSSDHGDVLGAHGGLHQKWMNLYDECVRVPFVVAHTGGFGAQGARIRDQLTSHVDLLPTLLGFAGGNAAELARDLSLSHTEVHPLPGRDLSGLVAGAESPDPHRSVYVMTRDNILEGDDGLNPLGRILGVRRPIGPFAASLPAYVGTSVEALVSRVAETDGSGSGHVWKLVRTHDDPQTWTEPGQRQLVERTPAGARYRERPLPAEWELYDLDADPIEGTNRAGDPGCAHVLETMKERLAEERRRVIPARNTPWPPTPAADAPSGAPVRPKRTARALRTLMARLGLHPTDDWEQPRAESLHGRHALIVTTSHGRLDLGKPTGVFASELTAPYYAFADAGLSVDVASVRGGAIPVDPISLRPVVRSTDDDRFLGDPDLQGKVRHSLALADVDTSEYDIVFLAGGWGAAFDLGTSPVVAEKMSEAIVCGCVIGGVCHGPLGLLQATNPDGSRFVDGRRLTAVTDKQVRELGITSTPQHPERELRAAGARFESATALRDIFANHVVCDGDLVTGQNQNAGRAVARHMMERLQTRPFGARGPAVGVARG